MDSVLTRRVVQERPYNASTPRAALSESTTPTGLVYVRNHFDVPRLDPARWRLAIDGGVARSLSLSLADLERRPVRSLVMTMECAGNGRTRMSPVPGGTPWDECAVSTSTWTGTPLAGVLAEAGIEPGVVEVVFAGADHGVEGGRPMAFERSLPIAQAVSPHVLLAWQMDGAPLAAQHGAPVRLIVPGWYGVASVKWLERITLATEPFAGWFQADRYVYRDARSAAPAFEPVARMRLKSLITAPQEGASLIAGRPTRVTGVAWSGGPAVERVDVSVDGGGVWHHAEIEEAASPYAWRQFAWPWRDPPAGEHVVLSRAFDEAGDAQPLTPVWNEHGYGYNTVAGVRVRVR